jgi:hypothetical protein
MAEQILDVNRPRRFGARFAHGHLRERREIFVEARAQRQSSFFIQRERADAHHHLGHRGELEDRVERHGLVRRLVEEAVRAVMNQPAIARNGHHRAGDAFGGDLALEESVDARESFLGKARAVRRDRRQRLRECDAGNEKSAPQGVRTHGLPPSSLPGQSSAGASA